MASSVLGYPLQRHHVALTLWHEAGIGRSPVDLQRAASRIFAQLECTATLLVPQGATSLWAWGARRSRPDPNPPSPDPPGIAGIHVARGTPGQGISGFRRSHLEASRAAQLAKGVTAEEDAWLIDYADIELAALLSHDLELARNLVTRELGPLAEDTPGSRELRETLSAYLESERSLVRSAEKLHIARNTVAYRVKKAETITGRDLKDRALELQCALRLAATVGPQVLTHE